MKKPIHKHRKNQSKLTNLILGGALVLTLVLIIALVVANQLAPEASDYVITADGHVHAADGTHLGTSEEMFGSDYVVTEDGHVHAADGTHLGTYDETVEEPADESAEEPAEEPTETEAN